MYVYIWLFCVAETLLLTYFNHVCVLDSCLYFCDVCCVDEATHPRSVLVFLLPPANTPAFRAEFDFLLTRSTRMLGVMTTHMHLVGTFNDRSKTEQRSDVNLKKKRFTSEKHTEQNVSEYELVLIFVIITLICSKQKVQWAPCRWRKTQTLPFGVLWGVSSNAQCYGVGVEVDLYPGLELPFHKQKTKLLGFFPHLLLLLHFILTLFFFCAFFCLLKKQFSSVALLDQRPKGRLCFQGFISYSVVMQCAVIAWGIRSC